MHNVSINIKQHIILMKQTKFTDTYFEDVEKYEKLYGAKTVVFIEKGEFMEMYGIETQTETVGHLTEVCRILDIACTLTNTKIEGENNRDNPLMAGIPTYAIQRHINKLLKQNYTIVMKTQTRRVGKTFEREVTDIISNGCYLDADLNFDASNIVCLVSRKHKHYKTKKEIISIGLSKIDVTTGMSTLYEVHDKPSTHDDYAINEAYRFIQVAKPKQIIYQVHDEDLIDKLGIENIPHTKLTEETTYSSTDYQQKYFHNLFPDEPINILQHLELYRYPEATISYMYLLNYVYERNKNFINNLKKPVYWGDIEHMILHHNTVYQLDLLSTDKDKQTLCKILNKCQTNMGKRLFEDWLLNPSTKQDIIQTRYNLIESLLPYDMVECKDIMKNVYDIERLFRRLNVQKIQPMGIFQIYKSLVSIDKIIEFLEANNIQGFTYNRQHILDFLEDIKKTFNLRNLESYSNMKKEIVYNIYNDGVNALIEEIVSDYEKNEKDIQDFVDTLNNSIDTKDNYFKLKREKKGYCIEVTQIRYKSFQSKTTLTDNKYLKFEKSSTKSTHKLTNSFTKEISRKIMTNVEQLNKETDEYFKMYISELHEKFHKYYYEISEFISTFDVIMNNSLISKKFKYVRPKIDQTSENGYINVKGLRHPIVEQIHTSEKYVTNDFELGLKENGMILFGLNASGKSVCLKAIGTAIIMAQAGMYTACDSMTYGLYSNLLTRILGNDNMSKSLSSFEVEMIELRNILNIADNRSLVLGDEICRGTEIKSGIGLVASSIITLSKRNTSFMYTTHLHTLSELDCINELKNVGIYHLSVRIENNNVIYNRKINKGSGESIYGIEVARAMNMDEEFIKVAYDIRGLLLNNDNSLMSKKRSKYNKNVVIDKCEMCEKNGEDVHHIGFQCHAVDNMIDHHHKNAEHNLVVLCKKCHQDVHAYKYEIEGWDVSVNGKVLKYKKLNKAEQESMKAEMDVPKKPKKKKTLMDFYN